MGSIIGAVSCTVIEKVLCKACTEIKDKTLSRREKIRSSVTAIYAISKIAKGIQEGNNIRNDDFFIEDYFERSNADELFEGIIISAQKEYEENKLQYYGNLFASIVFIKDISRSMVCQLMRLGQELSYSELCLLSIFGRKGEGELINLRKESYGSGSYDENLISVLTSINKLSSNSSIFSPTFGSLLVGITPNEIYLQGIGVALYTYMKLKEILEEDCKYFLELLE